MGENGNWYINDVDTGVPATGAQGNLCVNSLSADEIYCKYHPAYSGAEEEWIDAYSHGTLAASYDTTYNIIFILATVPPVLAALDSIDNGYETYAYIEICKTSSGIDMVNGFHNIGFDASSNQGFGFNDDAFNSVVDTIKNLNVFGNEKFNIYV